jgi:uncharacterized membrane protein YhaH (DUF805 family)
MSFLAWRLFSFKGRIKRLDFAILFFGLAIIQFFGQKYIKAHYIDLDLIKAHKLDQAIHMTPAAGLVIFLLSIAFCWMSLANCAKRLHDFGWSGWMVLAPGGVMVAGVVASIFLATTGLKSVSAMLMLAGLGIGALAGIVLHGMLLFKRGDDGENGHPRGPEINWDDEAPILGPRPAPRAASALSAPALSAPALAASAARDECQLNVYRSPQIKPTSFGRRSA